jgi:nitrate reductase gamma subunit
LTTAPPFFLIPLVTAAFTMALIAFNDRLLHAFSLPLEPPPLPSGL